MGPAQVFRKLALRCGADFIGAVMRGRLFRLCFPNGLKYPRHTQLLNVTQAIFIHRVDDDELRAESNETVYVASAEC